MKKESLQTLEGRLIKDGVRQAIKDRQVVLADLVHAIREYRKFAELKSLTLQGSITRTQFTS
jgi:hypothetical protein